MSSCVAATDKDMKKPLCTPTVGGPSIWRLLKRQASYYSVLILSILFGREAFNARLR
jgi:hypothetical protein